MDAVIKGATMKGTIRRRDSRANKIGVEEDAVEEEAAGRTTPTSSATSVTSMVIMRRIAAMKNVLIVVKWDTLQNIVEPIRRWKRQPT